MSDTTHMKCPRCGKELTAAAPEGLCPSCLGALNFATDTAIPEAATKETLPPLTPAELAPHFPQLEILECLGRGGMGVVYKARQKSLNRFVALKLLAPERVQDAKFAERFAREAQALAALNHPSIVTVHDFGQAGGFYFLLMEFVDGVNLRQLLRSRKLQPAEALAIVPPVCEALQYAHEHGIVHRDIKPENLLLAKDGRVKIADFGIAKMLGTDGNASSLPLSSPKGEEGQGEEALGTPVTQHTTMGTPQYMAPEQRDHSQSADHRADIYSLGVVLYELLTGELPADKLQPPSRVRGVQIDVRLDEIVLRALEKTPELRYQTAGEFKTQVEMMAAKPEHLTDKTPPRIIKTGKGIGFLPSHLDSYEGRLTLFQKQGDLCLDDAQITFTDIDSTVTIPLSAVRDLSLEQFPRSVNPAGINFISITYEEEGRNKHLCIAPMEGYFGTPWTFNSIVTHWFEAIREIVIATTGKTPESISTKQGALPSRTRRNFLLMLLPPLGLLGFSLLFLFGSHTSPGWNKAFINGLLTQVPLYIGVFGWVYFSFLRPSRPASPSFKQLGFDDKQTAIEISVVSFYAGIVLGVLLIGVLPFRFSRDGAYLVAIGIMAIVSPFLGIRVRKALLKLTEPEIPAMRLKLQSFAVTAFILALPLLVLGFFFLSSVMSQLYGWHPAISEAVLIPLTWIGAILLPLAGIRLWRAGRRLGTDLTVKVIGDSLMWPTLGRTLSMVLVFSMPFYLPSLFSTSPAPTAPVTTTSRPQHPTAVSKLKGAPFIAHLPDGASVELLAVRLNPSGTNQPWWKPDGTPSIYGADITVEGEKDIEPGVLALAKIKWPTNSYQNADDDTISMSGGRFALRNGLRLPNNELCVLHFDRVVTEGDEATLYTHVAVAPWKTVTVQKPGFMPTLFGGPSRKQWEFSETPNGNLKVIIKNMIRDEGKEYRLVAAVGDKYTFSPSTFKMTSSRGNPEVEYEAAFDGVGSSQGWKPRQIKEVRWLARPYESVEFRHVSLKPGNLTQLEVKDFGTNTTVAQATNTISEPTSPVKVSNSASASNQTPQEAFRGFATWRLIVLVLLLGLLIGSVVLAVWLSRKKGLKGCLLAGAIILGVLLGLVGLVLLLSFGYRATKVDAVHALAGATLILHPINQQPVPSEPNGLAMQVQNGLNVRMPGGQLATFEFYLRQADDTLDLVPALTARIATSPSGGFNGSVYWQGKRGDEARGTNQLWFWSVNGHTLGGQPLPSRPDYETNVTYHLRRDEVLNWWQLNLPSLTTMSLGETRDIPIFRTFGTATIHGDQPKEAIVRVKCETLPAGFKIDAGQYQLLFGTKHNQAAGADDAEANPAASPRSLVPQSVVDEARAEAKRAAALFDAARTTRTEVIAAEYHLKWAEAMFNGDVRSALQAKRDGAALKLESIDSLVKTGRISPSDRAKAIRELAEAEAALKQWELQSAK